jgi:hypothetical protein
MRSTMWVIEWIDRLFVDMPTSDCMIVIGLSDPLMGMAICLAIASTAISQQSSARNTFSFRREAGRIWTIHGARQLYRSYGARSAREKF